VLLPAFRGLLEARQRYRVDPFVWPSSRAFVAHDDLSKNHGSPQEMTTLYYNVLIESAVTIAC
jgi:hypothetical protein